MNPTKNLTALKVNGPMLSIPVSWAINVVPQINVQTSKQIRDTILFREYKRPTNQTNTRSIKLSGNGAVIKSIIKQLTCRQSLFLDFL